MSRASWSRYFWNHRPIVWWIMGGLVILVIGGIIGGIVTANESGHPNDTSSPTGVAQLPGGGGTPGALTSTATAASAVAGVPSNAVLDVEEQGFTPSSLQVPRGGHVTIRVTGVDGCEVSINGNSIGHVVVRGQEYTWPADQPGRYVFTCQGRQTPGAGVTVP